jgi:hypothetical protein
MVGLPSQFEKSIKGNLQRIECAAKISKSGRPPGRAGERFQIETKNLNG